MNARRLGLAAAAFFAFTSVRAQTPVSDELAVLHVRDGIYMLVGAGGNTTLHVGKDGVLVVDTKLATASDALLAAIRKISDKPIRYIVNTHWHADHVAVHDRVTRALEELGEAAPALYYVSMASGAMRALVDAAHARGGPRDGQGLWGISPDAFGVSTPAPTLRVDVRPWIDRKLAAIRSHRTQVGAGSPFVWIDESDAARLLGFEQFRRAEVGAAAEDVLEPLGEKGAGA